MNGKGDRRRPYDQKLWDKGYERIFGRPCTHPGCRCHVTHPCEVCGYQAGKNHLTPDQKNGIMGGSNGCPHHTQDIRYDDIGQYTYCRKCGFVFGRRGSDD